jgi:hypothetical protein
MRSILLTVPDGMKSRLDALRGEKGYSLNGYCRAAIARALAQEPKPNTGVVTVRFRKPGDRWRHRRVMRCLLENEILRLENHGAEIQVSKTGKANR